MQDHVNNINMGMDTVKLAPGVVYTGVYIAGISIQDWVAIVTFVYIMAQLLLLLPKYREWWRNRK